MVGRKEMHVHVEDMGAERGSTKGFGGPGQVARLMGIWWI